MSTIVTRAGKGSPLTHTEVDANFTNLNTDKYEAGATFNSATRAQTEAALIAGTNVTITPAGSGATRTLTIAATAGGSPTVITGVPTSDQADWNPAGFGSTVGTIILQPTTNSFISGLLAGAANQTVTLINDSNFLICLTKEDAASTAGNRFAEDSMPSIWLLPQDSITLRYSGTLSRWVKVARSNDVFEIDARTNLILPGSGTTVISGGIGSIATTATISTGGPGGTPTDPFAEYTHFQVTNSAASGTSSVRGQSQIFMRGATANRQGFFHSGLVRFTALGATGAVRSGLYSSTGISSGLNATLPNCLFLGADTSMTNLRIFRGDGSAGTAVDLGANFPTPSATASYEYAFLALPNSSSVQYMVRRLDTRFTAQGTLTGQIPTNTLGLAPRVEAAVGATAVANTVQCAHLLTAGL